MSVLIVIPARFASTRYPAKPLVELRGASGVSKTLIRRSWDAACQVSGVDRVVIATDDDRIRDHARSFGADVVMTSPSCQNGTERCAEAQAVLGWRHDVVVNLQGDAPLTPPWFVEELVQRLADDPQAAVATPVLRCDGRSLNGLLEDRRNNRVGGTTAVFAQDGRALYFSKEVIPFTSRTYGAEDMTPVYHHVGVYAYRAAVLKDYVRWAPGPLEILEGLEQLRFMEQGRAVHCVEVKSHGKQFWELNNPSDAPIIETMLARMGME